MGDAVDECHNFLFGTRPSFYLASFPGSSVSGHVRLESVHDEINCSDRVVLVQHNVVKLMQQFLLPYACSGAWLCVYFLLFIFAKE